MESDRSKIDHLINRELTQLFFVVDIAMTKKKKNMKFGKIDWLSIEDSPSEYEDEIVDERTERLHEIYMQFQSFHMKNLSFDNFWAMLNNIILNNSIEELITFYSSKIIDPILKELVLELILILRPELEEDIKVYLTYL